MCIILAPGYNDIKFNNLSSRVIVFTDLLALAINNFHCSFDVQFIEVAISFSFLIHLARNPKYMC